ncbi:MAG TPA: hypothetical protein ENH55_11685 [Aurantimonas coralicida]|uniref:Cytochrome c n=2 Tax=root TaxID=1 RepID=A0A9C9NKA0_9HYPH|nr:hypothetical protein [Aurantimonas coralicida]HEU03322.1 hypothetical protein [Aurantimonas coralicida]
MMDKIADRKRSWSIRGALWLGIVASIAIDGSVLAQSAEPVSPKLTDTLRDLLRKEMVSIEDASKQILSALVAGDNARVAELAQRIHDSFILQQSMTPEDRKNLMAAVPKGFVEQDRAFHAISAALTDAARSGDRAQQQEEFGKMIEACSACHAEYATDRFPKFAE